MKLVPLTSKAAVFHKAAAPLTFEEFPIPELKGSEVLARILCSTICASDLHTIGDRIAWSIVWSCGECFYCTRGLRPKCEKLMKFGHEKITPGRALIGGMAEHCHLPDGTAIFKVPHNVTDAVASSANCATSTVAAVFRYAGPLAGQVVVVHGAGMLGLTACSMAAVGGAAQVIVIEPDARRRAKALEFGGTKSLDSNRAADEILACVRELSDGRGADIAVELAGHPECIELGAGLLRMGGNSFSPGRPFPAGQCNCLANNS